MVSFLKWREVTLPTLLSEHIVFLSPSLYFNYRLGGRGVVEQLGHDAEGGPVGAGGVRRGTLEMIR